MRGRQQGGAGRGGKEQEALEQEVGVGGNQEQASRWTPGGTCRKEVPTLHASNKICGRALLDH